MLTDTLYVLEVISGGPSQKVGLMPGDKIIKVNDTVIAGVNMNSQDVVKMPARSQRDCCQRVGTPPRDAGADGVQDWFATRYPSPVSTPRTWWQKRWVISG